MWTVFAIVTCVPILNSTCTRYVCYKIHKYLKTPKEKISISRKQQSFDSFHSCQIILIGIINYLIVFHWHNQRNVCVNYQYLFNNRAQLISVAKWISSNYYGVAILPTRHVDCIHRSFSYKSFVQKLKNYFIIISVVR